MSERRRIVLVQRSETEGSRQGVPQFFGIGEETAGSTGISMNLTAFPPGASAQAHAHRGYETAIYTVSGRIVVYYGARLEEAVELTPGSFCFIPPDLPHKAYNVSETEPALAVTARNDSREQENVVLTPEADDGSPDQRIAQLRSSAG